MKPLKGLSIIAFLIINIVDMHTESKAQETDRTSWNRITSDKRYYWGEGSGESATEAKKVADADLSSRILVAVSVSEIGRKWETIEGSEFNFRQEWKKEISSFTSLYFMGLEHDVIQEDGAFRAIAYITKENLKKSFNKRKNQIRDFIKLGVAAEGENRITDALKYYYWAYLLSYTYPDTIQTTFNGVSNAEPLIALSERITSVISGIKTRVKEVYRDGIVVIAELLFSYGGKPVRNLNFHYYSGLGTDYMEVIGGEASIPIYDDPTFPERDLVLTVDYAAEGEMTANEEITHLYQRLGTKELKSTLTLKLIFPWVSLNKHDEISPQHEIPVDFPSALIVLANLHDAREFLRILAQYEKLGKIYYGPKDSLASIVNNYVAVIDDQAVWGVFIYNGKGYTEISSGRNLPDLSDEFRGKRQIWIESKEY